MGMFARIAVRLLSLASTAVYGKEMVKGRADDIITDYEPSTHNNQSTRSGHMRYG